MIQYLISKYSMTVHPEGGHFSEIYRSEAKIMQGSRNCSTAIYFLLENGEKSNFHRIKSDEMWHFYLGGPLEILEIDELGQIIKTTLGNDIKSGQVLTHIVLANRWFASRPLANSEFSFVGCTVSPGFDFLDFELANRYQLSKKYPKHQELINELTN